MKLCIVTIKEKAWTRAKEVCKALEYKKGRAIDVSKKHVSIEKKTKNNSITMNRKDAPQQRTS